MRRPTRATAPPWTGLQQSSPKGRGGRCRPAPPALSVLLLRPWLRCTAGEPAPFTTRKLASAKILGPVLLSQAVLKKVRWEGLEALAKPSRPTELHLESGPGPASCAGGRGWEMPSQPHSSLFLARPSTSNRTGRKEEATTQAVVSPLGTT